MEWGQQMRKHQQNARDAMYQNSNYSFERRVKKTVIIDYKYILTDSDPKEHTNWSTTLHEPLIIDKLSDVYLEAVITCFCNDNSDPNNAAFLFDVKEFNINTNCAVQKTSIDDFGDIMFNKVLLPNENPKEGTSTTYMHKAKKLNYICSINPCRLSQLTGTITNLNGESIFHSDAQDSPRRIIVELVIIARD